jgi:GR25 family glycosyltransferase involved in LPS biosynthesis
MDRIPKIFVINLPHRVDRLESIKKELERMGLLDKMEIVEGVIIDVGALGTAGVAEARARCLDLAQERGYEMVMILEDDCKFLFDKERIYSEIETFFNTAPADWNGLWFGSFYHWTVPSDLNWTTSVGIIQDTATIIHSRFYNQLINGYRLCRDKYIDTQDEKHNTDYWLGENNIKIYALKTKLCGQADCFSDRTFLDMNGGCSVRL